MEGQELAQGASYGSESDSSDSDDGPEVTRVLVEAMRAQVKNDFFLEKLRKENKSHRETAARSGKKESVQRVVSQKLVETQTAEKSYIEKAKDELKSVEKEEEEADVLLRADELELKTLQSRVSQKKELKASFENRKKEIADEISKRKNHEEDAAKEQIKSDEIAARYALTKANALHGILKNSRDIEGGTSAVDLQKKTVEEMFDQCKVPYWITGIHYFDHPTVLRDFFKLVRRAHPSVGRGLNLDELRTKEELWNALERAVNFGVETDPLEIEFQEERLTPIKCVPASAQKRKRDMS